MHSRLMAVCLLAVAAGTRLQVQSARAEAVLSAGSQSFRLAPSGALIAYRGEGAGLAGMDRGAGVLRYAGRDWPLDQPTRTASSTDAATFEYTLSTEPPLRVVLLYRLSSADKLTVVVREIAVQADRPLTDDLTVSLNLSPWSAHKDAWLPMKDGTAGRPDRLGRAAYRFAGKLPGDGAALAMPLVTAPSQAGINRVTQVTDVYYSSLFTPTAVEWTYPRAVGLEPGGEHRVIASIIHGGGENEAIEAFYRVALSDIAPGADWLHDIAMVDYDYLSDGGQGWFRDIDALSEAIPKPERSRVFLCLHGWYDHVGRYCFDPVARKLDREWTAFGNYEAARKIALDLTLADGHTIKVGFANCKPLRVTLEDVHRRLAYARTRGFRVGLYFGSGIESSDGVAHYTPDRVLTWGGWTGPDTIGKTFTENPLVPAVYAFYLDYADAILGEYGRDVDALVWDTTSLVGTGSLGTKEHPGYADRALMRLTRDVTLKLQAFNDRHKTELAFLTADSIGGWGPPVQPPYSLVAHGTYHDNHCRPQGNGPEIFPNYRNVVWLCNWWPLQNWRPAEFAVRHYQAPVPISNGWGDDVGFSEMSTAQKRQVLDLFAARKKNRTRLRWLDPPPVYTPVRPSTTSSPAAAD